MLVALVILFEILGVASALHAVMTVRTPQGAIAWSVSLVTFPYVAVPAYWVFGRNKFQGYVLARQNGLENLNDTIRQANQNQQSEIADDNNARGRVRAAETLARTPLTDGNKVDLLIDGRDTFESIFEGIDRAEHYVLVQSYIVRDDELGRALQERMIAAAERGLRVLFLYDAIGSLGLPAGYRKALAAAGVDMRPFHSRKGSGNRFQINFRDHRKTVVVDGRIAWVGGTKLATSIWAVPRSLDTGGTRMCASKVLPPLAHSSRLSKTGSGQAKACRTVSTGPRFVPTHRTRSR
jgi:cardiolipin synthase